jgi:hypothetical protein
MALTADEFEELKSLIGGGAQQETRLPPTGAGGGRGSALTGVTSPNQMIEAQRAAQQQQALEREKAAMEQEGFFGYTGRKGLDVLTGRGQGNLVSSLLTGPTGLFNRIAAPLGSTQAQQEMLAAQQQAEAEKQREQQLFGDRSFGQKVLQNVQNIGRYAVEEPKMFASQVGQQLFDPANVALGVVGAPVRGAGLLSNVGRVTGGGVVGAGIPSAVTSFSQGGLDAERVAEEAATGGVVNVGLYGAGRTVGATGGAIAKPFTATTEALFPLKQSIPKPIAELITTNKDIADTFNNMAELKKFYGDDFKPNLAELTKEVAVIDRAQLAAKNDVNAILSLRANRSDTESAFNAKLNSMFPSSDGVLQTFGKDYAKQAVVLQNTISSLDDTLKNVTQKFQAMGGTSPMDLGQATRELRDSIKFRKGKYWQDVFNTFKQEGDVKNITMSSDNVNTLYQATKDISVPVYETFDPVAQKAMQQLSQFVEGKQNVPFSLLHDYSNAINKEYSKTYQAASMGSADARAMLNQIKAAKDALDNGLSTLEGDFGTAYLETKAKYGSEFMGLFYEGFGGQLGKKNRFGQSIQDSDVASKLVSKPEYINNFIKLNDNNPLAQQAVTEALIQKFMKSGSVLNADGSIKPEKLSAFIYDNADGFNFVPSAKRTFQDLQGNLENYVRSKADMELRKANIADAATAQLLKKTRLEDVFNTNESGAFAKPEMLTKLLRTAEKDKTGAETSGIQRAMIEAAQKNASPSEFIVKNKNVFDQAFTGKQAKNLEMIEKGLDVLETKLNVRPGEKITNYKGLAVEFGIAGGLGFVSPFLSAGYVGLSMLVHKLRARKDRLESAAYVNALIDPEISKELLTGINKANAGIASGNENLVNTALSALKQTMINNGINIGMEQQPLNSVPMFDVIPQEQAPEQTQEQPQEGLSPAEFQELLKLQQDSTPRKQEVSSIIEDEAQKLGVGEHVNLLTKLANQESGFKQSALSPKGAIGVMQLMPATAQELGVDPYDLEQNVRGGVRYWAKQLKFFNGDVKLATAAYNAGAGNVIKAGNKVPDFAETKKYVSAIVG